MSMTTLSEGLGQLPRFQKRSFVPEGADLSLRDQVVGLFEKLRVRPVTSSNELEQWLMDRSELEAALDQVGSVLYIRMTCQTDNETFAEEYKKFIEVVIPAVKPLDDQLNQRHLTLRQQFILNKKRYEVYDRTITSDVELFRKENVPLHTQVQLLSQEYQTVCGAMSVPFQGEDMTMPQVSKFLQEPDRALRESAWRAMTGRRLQDRERLDELFDKMLKLRHTIALNAGVANFCEYQFHAYHRFDYTPQDCKKYHDSVAQLVVPVYKKILDRRKADMGVPALRPWDTQVDPRGRPALKPFVEVETLIEGTGRIFSQLDPELGTQFQDMSELGLLDLASRKGKAPGGYQNTLAEARKPFIFMNAVGVDDDVRTLLHEGGHAFHALAAAADPLYPYRHAPMEFCEVASMSMELLGNGYLETFYSAEDCVRSCQSHLEDVIHLLAWVATIDAFQHWIYEHPDHTGKERSEAWMRIYGRFGGDFLDWAGLEDILRSLWQRQLHIFEVPFYYIEYGIAQLGALQLWLNARQDQQKALGQYRAALALGGSRPLPELFQAAGLRFDFSAETIGPLVAAAEKELGL
jgi:oligoendopeptidase F